MNDELKSILEADYGEYAITQCEAFELFVHTDPWRALRDLTAEDEYRASLNLRGDNAADLVELVYPDPCFVSPFWDYEPDYNNLNDDDLLLFVEGLLKPRAKQLRYHSGGDYGGFPTSLRTEDDAGNWTCDG